MGAVEAAVATAKAEDRTSCQDHRRILSGILWVTRTGASWRDLPERYGPWSTIRSSFQRWHEAGIWDRLFVAVQQPADAAGALYWEIYYVDGTVV